jgi:hypothetical protein
MLDNFGNWNPLISSIIEGSGYENAHIWRVYELEKLNPFIIRMLFSSAMQHIR